MGFSFLRFEQKDGRLNVKVPKRLLITYISIGVSVLVIFAIVMGVVFGVVIPEEDRKREEKWAADSKARQEDWDRRVKESDERWEANSKKRAEDFQARVKDMNNNFFSNVEKDKQSFDESTKNVFNSFDKSKSKAFDEPAEKPTEIVQPQKPNPPTFSDKSGDFFADFDKSSKARMCKFDCESSQNQCNFKCGNNCGDQCTKPFQECISKC